MSSKINRNGTYVRPEFRYADKERTVESSALELAESARNVLEDINKSQMLQCDVAHAIKGMAINIQDIAKTLRRIDRRMAKKIRL